MSQSDQSLWDRLVGRWAVNGERATNMNITGQKLILELHVNIS